MACAQHCRSLSRGQQAFISLRTFNPGLFRSSRAFSSAAEEQGTSRGPLLAGLGFGGLLALTWLAEEAEIRKATEAVERGSKPTPSVTGGKQVRREHIQNSLVDLLRPYVCSMSQIDIVWGHEGTGRTKEVQEACRDVDGGVVYVDLQGSGEVGSHILQVLTGEQNRGLLQRFRDLIRGGKEAHGILLLEAAVQRYLRAHDRYPVIAFDNVDPQACRLEDAASPLLRLGRASNADAPSLRPVIILDDAELETLQREAHPLTDYSVALAIEDAAPEEAKGLLLQQNFPGELAERVVELVGGRLSHLQEAISYYVESPRWLSPMRPGATQEDFNAAVAAHFAEIKKMIYWDLDKRLRIVAGIGLWPSATGDAPVQHQNPTDENARQIIELLDAINLSPLPSTEVREAIGETRYAQLLKAQVLGFLPLEGPLHKRESELVGFGSPAMQHYFLDRLASPSIKKASSEGGSGWTAWTKLF